MNIDTKKFIYNIVPSALFLFLIWMVKCTELLFDLKFSSYGLKPGDFEGLRGIIFSPLIHSDFKHLFSNSVPLIILGSLLFYFYNTIASRIFFIIYILSGVILWFIGRPSYHIGASGLVYGLVAFLFFSGIIRKYYKLTAISLLVVFLYGSMVWGMVPIDNEISWEGHLSGFVVGTALSVIYRNRGPKRKLFYWEHDDYIDEEDYFYDNNEEIE